MSASKKFILLALALVLAVAGMGMTARPAQAAAGGCARYHWVSWGETLYSIGMAYGVNYQQIARTNNIGNPRFIYAGQVLCIPAGTYGTGGPYYSNYNYNYYPYGYGGQYQYNYYNPGYYNNGYYYYYNNYNYNNGYYWYNYPYKQYYPYNPYPYVKPTK